MANRPQAPRVEVGGLHSEGDQGKDYILKQEWTRRARAWAQTGSLGGGTASQPTSTEARTPYEGEPREALGSRPQMGQILLRRRDQEVRGQRRVTAAENRAGKVDRQLAAAYFFTREDTNTHERNSHLILGTETTGQQPEGLSSSAQTGTWSNRRPTCGPREAHSGDWA